MNSQKLDSAELFEPTQGDIDAYTAVKSVLTEGLRKEGRKLTFAFDLPIMTHCIVWISLVRCQEI